MIEYNCEYFKGRQRWANNLIYRKVGRTNVCNRKATHITNNGGEVLFRIYVCGRHAIACSRDSRYNPVIKI